MVLSAGYRDPDPGRWIPGVETTVNLWASRDDLETTVNNEAGGARPLADRRFMVRWRQDLWQTPPGDMQVIDEGRTYGVINVAEFTAGGKFRRRWLTLETLGDGS